MLLRVIDNSGAYDNLISAVDNVMKSEGFKKVKDYV